MDNYNKTEDRSCDISLENMSFFDVLKLPVPVALSELARRGAKIVKSIKQTAQETFNSLADEEYSKMCRTILTMDDCVEWIKVQKSDFPQIAYLFIYVEKNNAPRNENDLLSIAVAGLDATKKAIPIRKTVPESKLFPKKKEISASADTDIICVVIPAKTIDEKMINVLNGNPSVLIKL